ncbi:MAG: hypothetical protein ABF727_07225, partial [Gluconobacter oxydans]
MVRPRRSDNRRFRHALYGSAAVHLGLIAYLLVQIPPEKPPAPPGPPAGRGGAVAARAGAE